MNLKKLYENDKEFRELTDRLKVSYAAGLGTLLFIAFITFIIHLLYNYVAPVWSLPKLSFLQALASISLLKVLSILLFNSKREDICIKMKPIQEQ